MKPTRALLFLTAAFLGVAAKAADPLQMDVKNAFEGPMAGTSSVVVELSNDGPDARGAVVVSSEGDEITYPVELPRGSRKRLLTLPRARWGDIEYSLETNQGRVVRKMSANGGMDEMASSIASIGDDSGSFAFLRQTTDTPQTNRPGGYNPQAARTRDVYTLPEVAPDRPAAYRPFSAVFIGPGAERIPDGAVAALRDYAVGGGTVVFVGGASAPTLEDRRWADVMPGSGWRPQTLSGSKVLSSMGGVPITGAFTVLSPTRIAPGTTAKGEGGTTIASERPLGLGRIVVLGFSPIDSPLSAWAGRARALAGFVRGGAMVRGRSLIAAYTANGDSDSSMSYRSYPPTIPKRSMPGVSSLQNDPFSTKLPPSGTVFGVLGLYFLLVVPVSFLLLRKLKRGEWAWFTAPILSLVFAGLLFKSAQGLYGASLSTSTQGVVVVQEGVPDAMFYGTSQMFFPRGGVYDLNLHGVDSIVPVGGDEYYYGRRQSSLAGFNPIDVGEIVAPRLEANNLSFREVGLSQRIDDGGWIRIVRQDEGHAVVTNLSPYTLNGSLAHGKILSRAFDLPPGGSRTVNLTEGDRASGQSPLPPQDARNFTNGNGRVAFSGTMEGFRPGPQIGDEVPGRGRIAVLAFGGVTIR